VLLDQQAGKTGGFIGGDAAGYAQQDGFVVQHEISLDSERTVIHSIAKDLKSVNTF
jgi:hypothetical protein